MEDIRGHLKIYKKQDIAMEHLNLALREYVADKNLISVIHLAGAAEEMLGKIVSINKKESALEVVQRWSRSWYKVVGKDSPSNKELNKHIIKVKNGIKHINDQGDLEIEFEIKREAEMIIQRAIENFNKMPNLRQSDELLAYYQCKKHNECSH